MSIDSTCFFVCSRFVIQDASKTVSQNNEFESLITVMHLLRFSSA